MSSAESYFIFAVFDMDYALFFFAKYDKISLLTDKMTKITEKEFAKICIGIYNDREIIRKHNPIGETMEETLLWMLMSCLHSYLSLTEIETPCFNGTPTKETYHDAILFILKHRKAEDFDEVKYLKEFS